MAGDDTVKITEKDAMGHEMGCYVLTTTVGGSTSSSTSNSSPLSSSTSTSSSTRLDLISERHVRKRTRTITSSLLSSPSLFLTTTILPVFLPAGYPHTVTADYTPYQIYDSLQAFASTIAGLLSSRAVLQSLGFETANSTTSTATYATLLSILQSTISNLSQILFAHRVSSRISSEVKFYRFLADIVNDIAFVLDCLSPSLPHTFRIPALCLSSASRSICGVAGGSSKAVLSAHFAKNGNIGELNAKDGSQETVINLIGMWVGGVVVSRVEGVWATWGWMLALLALHLWFNYCAVRCVRLRGLNGVRAEIVLDELIGKGRCLNVDEVGQIEGVFQRGSCVRLADGSACTLKMGVGLTEFVGCIGGNTQLASGSMTTNHVTFQQLINMFEKEQYLLWLDLFGLRKVVILLREGASTEDHLKAWCHAVRLSRACNQNKPEHKAGFIDKISQTLSVNNTKWGDVRDKVVAAGWDVSSNMLVDTSARRYAFS